jgi:hypothetical protein
MASKKVTAVASGFGGLLWNERAHHKAELTGLTIDNQYTAPQKIQLYDGFTTTSGYFMSGGAAQSMEDLGVTNVLSGKIRLQMSVPAGETQKLGEEDLAGTEFLGKATVIASADSSDCVVIAQYRYLKG